MNHPSEFAALFRLPLAERLQLVEDLWDSIAAEGGAPPVDEAVIRELHERAARYDADPASAAGWDEVQRKMREP
jgi:putative addiction module component (TIGR02574 family)